MNLSEWSYPNPCNTNIELNTFLGRSLNCSSGYESASNDSSLLEPCASHSLSMVKVREDVMLSTLISERFNAIKASQSDIDEESIDYASNYHPHPRPVLSRSQREEANRRERHRMEVLNHAYERLRNILPFKKGRKRQKMSRMDTVDGAIKHIQSLLDQLNGSTYSSEFTGVSTVCF